MSKQEEEIQTPIRRCTHGPNIYCLNCMNRQFDQIKKVEEERRVHNIKTPGTMKQPPKVYKLGGGKVENPQNEIKIGTHHTQGGKVVKGVITAKRGRPVGWMCRHKPGEVCSNCIGQKIADQEKEEKKKMTTQKQSMPSTIPRLTKNCKHGYGTVCIHCIPDPEITKEGKLEQKEQKEKKETPKETIPSNEPIRCPYHGPKGICTQCMKIMDDRRISIEKTKSVCKLARFSEKEIFNFQLYVSQRSFHVNRYGILYGRFRENDDVIVDAIFEPEQMINEQDEFVLTNEIQNNNIEELAQLLGLQRVGIIFSHNSKRNYLLSTNELIEAAKRQIEWDRRCITAVCCMKGNGISVDVYQASSQLEEIIKRNILDPVQKSKVTTSFTDEVFVEGRTHKELSIDSTMLLCNVAVKFLKTRLVFPNPLFPIENRPDQDITLNHFKEHFKKTQYLPVYDQLADFHLLTYCTELGIFSSNTVLRDCIVNKQEKSLIKDEIKQWLDLDM